MSLPCGTRNYTYAKDMAILRTKTHWVLFIGFLVLLFTAPLYLSNYWLGVANLIGITLIAATGLNILVGYCGQLSIGHAGFIAVGAYTAAILTNRLELPFLVGLNLRRAYRRDRRAYLRHPLGAGQGLLSGHYHHRRPVYHYLGHQPLGH